jgi:hypothetical protein
LDAGGWYQGPFVEALYWITALQDIHRKKIDYKTTEGQTLMALEWARNYATHQLLAPTKLWGGSVLPAAVPFIPGSFGIPVWKGEAELPPRRNERKKPDPTRAVYQTLVVGKGVLEPLNIAETYLRSLP